MSNQNITIYRYLQMEAFGRSEETISSFENSIGLARVYHQEKQQRINNANQCANDYLKLCVAN